MTKPEAIRQMSQGKKVTHHYFSEGEWATMEGNEIVLEDGVRVPPYEFWRWRQDAGWEDGWELYN